MVVGNPLANVSVSHPEPENVKNLSKKVGFSDFVTLQQPRMEGSTASSKLQSEVEREHYMQDGSCKVADVDFATLVSDKVGQIRN